MLQAQLNAMKELQMESVTIDNKFVYQHSSVKQARIASISFKNSIFRSVRLTYFDAGDSVQVFNSLWCPHYQYDIPMLGIDLISLGKSRVLSVIDFQPLIPTEEYSEKYISPLSSIRDKYPSLQGTLSGKIYDDTSFFSKNMLFGRFTDESKLMSDVLPAFDEYLQQYVQLAQSAVPNHSSANIAHVMERQKAYEVYSAAKDPAVGLFDAYFGKQWSSDFVHEYLFPLSARSDGSYTAPVHNFQPPTPSSSAPVVAGAGSDSSTSQ
jgi:15,16-dihydrobiliverdin:ferredoxin oxidoreductase